MFKVGREAKSDVSPDKPLSHTLPGPAVTTAGTTAHRVLRTQAAPLPEHAERVPQSLPGNRSEAEGGSPFSPRTVQRLRSAESGQADLWHISI